MLPEGEPVRILSETRRRKDLVKKHSEFDSVTLTCTSEDRCSQTKLTCQEHVPERIVEQIIECASATADFGRDRRSDEAGPT